MHIKRHINLQCHPVWGLWEQPLHVDRTLWVPADWTSSWSEWSKHQAVMHIYQSAGYHDYFCCDDMVGELCIKQSTYFLLCFKQIASSTDYANEGSQTHLQVKWVGLCMIAEEVQLSFHICKVTSDITFLKCLLTNDLSLCSSKLWRIQPQSSFQRAGCRDFM